MSTIKDLTGMRFGRLTVVRDSGRRSSGGNVLWECVCDCGKHSFVSCGDLKRGKIVSCGCYAKEAVQLRSLKRNIWIKEDGYYRGIANNTNIEFFISECDFEKCKDINWGTNYDKHTKTYYVRSSNKGELSRFVLNVADKTLIVDHINHNTLDNRRENLRVVSSSCNSMNRRLRTDNSSGVTGVRWHKATGKWQADIMAFGTNIYLGLFVDKDDAIKARKEAEDKYFGEYSYDNSIRRK